MVKMRNHASSMLRTTAAVSLWLHVPHLHLVSSITSSNSRPPMSLSSIINDLEAEGVSRGISSATILGSRTVSAESRSALLRRILGSGLSEEERSSVLDDVDDDVTSVGKVLGDGAGLALATASSASDAASTVRACGRRVVYVASGVDLGRGEGLFDTLAPAVETILNYAASTASSGDDEEGGDDGGDPSSLVVVLPCHSGDAELFQRQRAQFGEAATAMLSTLVRPSGVDEVPTSLEGVFDRVTYLTQDDVESDGMNQLLDELCPADGDGVSLREPSDALAAVSAAVPFSLEAIFMFDDDAKFRNLPPADVAVATKLLPVKRTVLAMGLSIVAENASDGDGTTILVSNFGELCDAAIKRSLEAFDSAAGPELTKRSGLVRGFRSDLQEELTSGLELMYEKQLAELKVAMFDKFKRDLSGLRVSPNIASDMEDVMKESVKEFAAAAAKIQAKGRSTSSWHSLGAAAKSDFRKSMKEYCTDRLQAARVSGAFKPVPRKAVSLGFHWLLPKPFGSDYRQASELRENLRNYVYHPVEGRAEVSPDEVRKGTGEWKNKIVPNPAGSDITYQGQ